MRTARQVGSDARRLWRACQVDGSLDERRVRAVFDGMLASRQARAAPVLSQLLRLVRLDRARHAAHVASAAPLDPDVRAAVESGLVGRYGPALTTTFAVEPALIGGMRVQVGSDVWDGSVKAGLETLEARF